MNKTDFKKTLSSMADDLYSKGYRDGASSALKIQLITLESEAGTVYAFRLGINEHARIVEIPASMIDTIKGDA